MVYLIKLFVIMNIIWYINVFYGCQHPVLFCDFLFSKYWMSKTAIKIYFKNINWK